MTNKVFLSNGRSFDVDEGQTILSAAVRQGVLLEHSCRTGRCGVCRVKVEQGATEALVPEDSLADTDSSDGYILTCCRTAIGDVLLAAEDLGELGIVSAKTLPCRIDALRYLSDDVLEVVLRTPPASKLEYLPGQYIDVIGVSGIRRSYSIANARREDGKIALHIRKVDGGRMSQYWFGEAKVNDLLRLEGALGTFCLRSGVAKSLVLLATGTGIAPLKAILEQLAADTACKQYDQIYLYWGGRIEKDIYWRPDFPKLPLFFTPVLSRCSTFKGRTGYVQQAVLADSIDLTSAEVYACGSDVMIRSALESMLAAGLDKNKFYSDAFVSSSL
ncbi:FAD-binding oxidoreductase [Pseudomonas sp. ENNP23]|uniref:FAD-binding oxidoreductase n=1 Tax=Pseudomonas sp. ENNP23 TaxID=1535636 RepID=UPI0009F5D3C7|nr:FAD-binding oxidoreductase [Pseudomonas sp. ENNP23]